MNMPYAFGSAVSALAIIAGIAAAPAAAQNYPTRTIQIICPSAPGGGSDTLVRLIAKELETLSGQPVVVVNKAGAGGLLGTRTAIGSKPDGYTLFIHASSAVVGNAYVVKDAGYDPKKDLVPIATISTVGFALAVGPKSPAKSVAELTALLKEKQGKAKFSSPNNATVVATELYKQAAGVDAIRVNYKATPAAIADVAADEVDFTFADMQLAVSQARAGRVKLLAVTTPHRASMDPSVPTMKEAGIPKYEYGVFFGAWAPKGTPKPVTDKLSQWIQQITSREDVKAEIVKHGFDPLPGSGQVLARMMDEDAKHWQNFVKSGKLEAQ
jgi:tripartite-type tricarboxylate transporter receptor subunit TctC